MPTAMPARHLLPLHLRARLGINSLLLLGQGKDPFRPHAQEAIDWWYRLRENSVRSALLLAFSHRHLVSRLRMLLLEVKLRKIRTLRSLRLYRQGLVRPLPGRFRELSHRVDSMCFRVLLVIMLVLAAEHMIHPEHVHPQLPARRMLRYPLPRIVPVLRGGHHFHKQGRQHLIQQRQMTMTRRLAQQLARSSSSSARLLVRTDSSMVMGAAHQVGRFRHLSWVA